MLSPGVETWRKNLLKVGLARKARVPLGLQDQTPGTSASGPRRQGPWRLASGLRKTSFCTFLKPHGLYPLAHIKCSCTQTFRETSETPFGEFRNPSGDQNTIITYIFTSGLFRRSSSCPGSHPGLRTTFGHQHNNSTILIVTKR
jgi:hypothetical protein